MSLIFQLDQTKKKKGGIAFWIKLSSYTYTLVYWMEHDANTWLTVDMCLSDPNQIFFFLSQRTTMIGLGKIRI